MSDFSPQALDYGRRTAAKLFAGRKGHGGGPCSRRVFTEAELVALCAIAFGAGQAAGANEWRFMWEFAQ